MAQIETGSSTAGKANVDSAFNLNVTLPQAVTAAGFTGLALEYDDATYTSAGGTRKANKVRSSLMRRLSTGTDVHLFSDWFPGAALNTALWTQTATTMTSSVASGRVNLNSGSGVAINTNIKIATVQNFTYTSGNVLVCEWETLNAVAPIGVAGADLSMGLMGFSGTSIVDGVYFQFGLGALQQAVVNVNGTITTKDISAGGGGVNITNTRTRWKIELGDDEAHFFVNDKLVAEILASVAGTTKMHLQPSLPFVARILIGGTVAGSAPIIQIGSVYVGMQDGPNTLLPGNHLSSYAGNLGYQGQTGNTMGSTQNYLNSTNPAAAVPTNTTAALTTGLGGLFFETDTLAAGTDGIVQSFQVPASAQTNIGKSLLIYGVTIQSTVSTALTAGGYTAAWSLAFGSSAVSLATAETLGTSKAPRRVGIGWQMTPANAAIHTTLPPVTMRFDGAPIVVHPGEFIQAVKKKAFGTAPTAGVVSHLVTYDCAWV